VAFVTQKKPGETVKIEEKACKECGAVETMKEVYFSDLCPTCEGLPF